MVQHFLNLNFFKNIGQSEHNKLGWLLQLRWLAIVVFFFLGIPGYIFGFLSAQTLIYYVAVLGLLFLFNLTMYLFWQKQRRIASEAFLAFQLATDALCLSALLFFAGGYENPFVSLFYFHAAIGGLLIVSRLSWSYLLLLHTLLAILQLQLLYANMAIPISPMQMLEIQFFTNHFLLFVFWFAFRSVGQYLERQSRMQSNILMHKEKQDRLKSLGALSAGFSHEFASPLSAAQIRLSRLLRALQSSAYANNNDLLAAIEALKQCESVIKQMNSAQLDARSYDSRDVELADLLRKICQAWLEENNQAELLLNITVQQKTKISELHFAQVIMNLLDNALEASIVGHHHPHIEISLRVDQDQWELLITDQGAGFSSDILNRLGEPFVTDKQEGTGLGLYVSNLFMQTMGGRLEVQNRPEGGAMVKMKWPVSWHMHDEGHAVEANNQIKEMSE